jgi:guanine nucleotide-binding protein G(i) subunit alpha
VNIGLTIYSHASAQRKILLHKTRQIRKDDAKSLKILARSSKVNGGCISALTHVSRMIQWLRGLFYLKVSQQESELMPTEEDYDFEAAAIRSEAIDRTLQDDATSLRRETKLVLMGSITSGKELIMHQMKVLYADGYYSTEERRTYCYAVRSTLRLLIHSIIDLLKDTGINLPKELNQHFAILLHEVETVDMQQPTPESVKAIEKLWTSPEFSTLYIRNFEIDFPQYASYFAQESSRIASPDYIPSEADIIRLNQSHRGIKELRFKWDELDVHLFNIHGYIPEHFRKRWFHQLEGATSLVYTVDVSQYDRPYLGQPTSSQLLDDFATFESWASNEKFANSSIILLLNNYTRFREKLPYSPLEGFFPDYVLNEADPETSARQYILRRFKDMNRNGLSIYSFWVDLEFSDNQPLYAALKNTLQHIQQQRARNGVWNGSMTTMSSGSRSGTGLASKLLRSRSGTLDRKGAGSSGSRITSSTLSGR